MLVNSIFQLKDVAKRVGLSSSEKASEFLESMISSSKLNAHIEGTGGNSLVVFDQETDFDNLKMQEKLASQIVLSDALVEKISKLDRDIQRDPKYISKTLNDESDDKHEIKNYSKLNS